MTMVALNPENEVVAHQSYTKGHPGSLVAELGAGIVDPRYRGRGLFEKIKKTAIDYGRDQGLYGLFIESVAVHPYSQRANRALGARETGILLGYIPIRSIYKKIDEATEQRRAVVLMYNRLNREPDRTVYPPYHTGPSSVKFTRSAASTAPSAMFRKPVMKWRPFRMWKSV